MTLLRCITLGLIYSLFVMSCKSVTKGPSFKASSELAPYCQESFDNYLLETKEWIGSHRVFLTDRPGLEVNVNSPFELKPDIDNGTKRGILLVHGLGDTPWYFQDIAKELVKNGWLVRAVLLPGHGTKPADLLLANYKDWEKLVAHHSKLLLKEVDELWLAGFSTGGNLVTTYALANKHVTGLLLFSPGFYSRHRLLRFSALVSYFWDWIDVDEENNISQYQSLPTNAARLYYQSMKALQEKLEDQSFDRPALIFFSENDCLLDPDATIDAFQNRFTNPHSRLIWYGSPPAARDERIKTFSSRLPGKRISTFSHMNVLFSPENRYYGENGSHIILDNGQGDAIVPLDRSDLWFSAWGYTEKGKYHARLTWNPYFADLLKAINDITKEQYKTSKIERGKL